MIAKVFLNWEIRDDQSIQVKWVIIYKHRGQSMPYIQPVLEEAHYTTYYAARVPWY